MVYEGVGVRSGEVGWGRVRSTELAKVFGAFVGRPDGFGSSDFAHIVDSWMLYRSIWLSGADVIEIMDFLTEEGSKFDDLSLEKSAEI